MPEPLPTAAPVSLPRSSRKRAIQWLQVCALGGVQGTIALAWVIYTLYLQNLLTSFGFTAAIVALVLWGENLLGAVIEPVMGGLSDQAQRWLGSRFSFIALGVVLASATFILIPTVVILGTAPQTRPFIGPIVPGILMIWGITMAVWRSPVLALLGHYATARRLPQAASVLTLVASLIGAMGMLWGRWILEVGPVVAFGLGSLLLLLSTLLLWFIHGMGLPESSSPRSSSPPRNPPNPNTAPPLESPPKSPILRKLLLIFGTGFGITLGARLLLDTVPRLLNLGIPEARAEVIVAGLFLGVAIGAIPAGSLAQRFVRHRALLLGLTLTAGFSGAIVVAKTPGFAMALALVLGMCFSVVANGALTLALTVVPPERSGLGLGVYFSGGAIGTSMFLWVLLPLQNVHPNVAAILAAGAFLLAGFFVAASDEPPASSPQEPSQPRPPNLPKPPTPDFPVNPRKM